MESHILTLLVDFIQDKEILLFHSSNELVYNGAPAKFQKSLKAKLKKLNISLILGAGLSKH